jgi:hypothetical protein
VRKYFLDRDAREREDKCEVRLDERMLWVVSAPEAVDPEPIVGLDRQLGKDHQHVVAPGMSIRPISMQSSGDLRHWAVFVASSRR